MGRAGAEPDLKLLDLLMIPRQRTQGSNARRTERSTGRRVGLSPCPVPTQPATHTRAGTARVGIGIPRGTAEAVPSPWRGAATAALCSPGHPGRCSALGAWRGPAAICIRSSHKGSRSGAPGGQAPPGPRAFLRPGGGNPSLGRPSA